VARFILAAAICSSVAGAAGTASAVDFKGKTVKLMLNLSIKSSTNLTVRQLAPFIGRHLPGQPTIVVVSKSGGGRMLAAALLARMKPDGRVLGVNVGLVAGWAFGQKIPMPPNKLTTIGALSGEGAILVRRDIGVNKAEDFRNLGRPVIYGASRLNTAHGLRGRLFFKAIGVPYKVVAGYKGQGGTEQALTSREVDIIDFNFNRYLANRDRYKRQGRIKGLMFFGYLDDKGIAQNSPKSDVETTYSAWKRLAPKTVGSPAWRASLIMNKIQTLSRLYSLPPGAPNAVVATWDKALKKAHFDPEYLAMLRKTGQDDPDYSNAARTNKLMHQIKSEFSEKALKEAIATVMVKG